MAVDVRIDSLQFSGAEEPIEVGESDLIVLIGPNNAGKSAALREIAVHVREGNIGVVLSGLKVRREGSEAELLEWLDRVGSMSESVETGRGVVSALQGFIPLQSVTLTWNHSETLNNLAAFFLVLLDAEGRLQLTGRVGNISVRDGHPSTPLQRLLLDVGAEKRLAEAVRSAFGEGVTLTRAGGADLQLLLGETRAEARVDNPDYLEELQALPAVETQGDGMRSFIGILLTLIATDFRLVLIDEPEAFLHPPQARELGRRLAALGGSQRIISTHDSDVLLGLIDGGERATIVRLRREGDRNVPAVLSGEQVETLWRDPALRYSNLLDGLFHKGVVICEADGDATIYGAALDFERSEAGAAAADILFTQCTGKHRMPGAIGALMPMQVPVAAIVDLDVLREEALLERIVDALGGDWGALRDDWAIVSAAVDHLPVDAPTIESVREQIEETLGEDPTTKLDERQSRRIREITASTDGWRRLKEAGLRGVPNGEATAAASRLSAALERLGAFVVPVGQLEGWAPEIGGHGPRFVDQALAARAFERREIRTFVARVAAHLLGDGESGEAPGVSG